MSGEEPDAGDPAGISALATTWHDHADALQRARDHVARSATYAAPPNWDGAAQRAFVALLDELAPAFSTLVGQLDAAGDAFDQYASDVQRIRDDADDLRRLQQANGNVLASRSRSLPGLERAARADGATEADQRGLAEAQHALADAHAQAAAYDARWQQLEDERATADAAVLRVITGTTTLGRLATVAGTSGATSDADLAAQLRGLTPTELGALLALDPTIEERIAAMGPEQAASFWDALGDDSADGHSATQDTLVALAPAVIGNLGGVPGWARDRANRVQLTAALTAARKEFWAAEDAAAGNGRNDPAVRDRLDRATTDVEAYENILQTLAKLPKQGDPPPRMLLTLATDHHPPLAAVSVGDVDTAENVTYMVPGMGTTTKDTSGWTTAAQNLWSTQELSNADGTSHAVVAWMDYEAPPVPPASLGVLHGDAARAGADRLVDDLLGFQATRHDGPTLNVVGHSYGTTTAADALHDRGVHVDTFVSVASAGIEQSVHGAGDLSADHVYAGQGTDGIPFTGDARDDWAGTGRMLSGRRDPMQPSFGAHTFGTNGGSDSDGAGVTTHDPIGYRGDEGYFNMNTESLRNIARATFDGGRGLTPADSAAPTVMDDWANTPGGPSLGGRR